MRFFNHTITIHTDPIKSLSGSRGDFFKGVGFTSHNNPISEKPPSLMGGTFFPPLHAQPAFDLHKTTKIPLNSYQQKQYKLLQEGVRFSQLQTKINLYKRKTAIGDRGYVFLARHSHHTPTPPRLPKSLSRSRTDFFKGGAVYLKKGCGFHQKETK